MSVENPFEGREDENNAERQRDIFWNTLNELITQMELSGEMTPKEAEEKRASGSLIETGFGDDPEYDAYIFSIAEWIPEEKLIEHFEKQE